jgi:ligand-binding sensor domain-containing protein
LNTKGCTLVVDLSVESEKRNVKNAENSKNAIKKIGIIQDDELIENYVKNVFVKNQSKKERFVSQRVGFVRNIEKKTKVYNLTINKIPAFDTLV